MTAVLQKKLHKTQELQSKFHKLKIYILYILFLVLLLFYNSSILDIEHSPYYIALVSIQTHIVI